MTISVLHVYRTYLPDPTGGLQEAIRQIALSSKPFGVESKIFALSPHPEPAEIERSEGLVLRSRSWLAPASCDLGGLAAFRHFDDLSAQADVVHYHFPWPFSDLLHFVVRPQCPAVMTYHSDIVRQKLLGRAYAPLMNRMLRSMSAVVATSPAYARTSAVLSKSEIAELVRVIPLGIDSQSYPEIAVNTVFERLGIGRGEAFFLFIGVLRYYKGLHTLVEAARRVNAKVVIAGSGPEGEALQVQAHQLCVSNVVFAGQVTDGEKVALLQCCLAVVLPSHLRSEAYGMVLVEAAMFGKPMISCEIGTGTSFVNANGKTGFVVSPGNPSALAEAMNHLLADSELAEQFGQAARMRYELIFSGEALGKAYSSLYYGLSRKDRFLKF